MTQYPIAVRRGDTWDGLRIDVEIDGVPADLDGATAAMHVRRGTGTPMLLELRSDGDEPGITLDGNAVVLGPVARLDLPVGSWRWDLELTLADGTRRTWIGGRFAVAGDITDLDA